MTEMSMDDEAEVRRVAADLDAIDTQGFPRSFRHLAVIQRVSVAVTLKQSEDALRHLDELDREDLPLFDLPVRHFLRASASLGMERWDEAAQAAQRYLSLLGEDAEAYSLLGLAQAGQEDLDAALASFDKGIDDDPLLPDNYAAIAYTAMDTALLAERLQRAPDHEVLDGIAQWLVDSEDQEGLNALLSAAARSQPSWDIRPWTAKAAELRAGRDADSTK